MITLENENIRVTFDTKGAELRSITGKTTGIEYLWKGDPEYWGKFSPVLFPVIGALKEETYIVEGKEYHLPRHGFARDHEFRAERISETEVLFTLSSSADTLKVYPFEFVLGLRYVISGSAVSCTYEVHNPAEKDLLFSIGGHPAFAAPLTDDASYEDCYLEFAIDESLKYHKIENNLISDQTDSLHLDHGKMFLRHALFYDDALVFKHMESRTITLKNTINDYGLHFRFNDFPFFGIWAAKDADFICLEPWCGIADGIAHNQQLSDKEGIISLSPGEHWKRVWEVEVF
ncbi:aldose 1-epimerase family protein [Pedobacter sp. MC2016-15]|uniref:aldose 1-epimerase family protein n=1 Tax=Pedobacter sp. MC2016-15 TaxID=2994473 RepID=UPI002247C501|nr:aldose 1-epimerase family protein [Pedobacter sp. MC2016-15]MCX2480457.1 aldose 1-epimerase family protein [Pedobacter sp. MC2016-15]